MDRRGKKQLIKLVKPWRWSLFVISSVICAGILLQIFTDSIDLKAFRSPINLIIGGIIILLPILFATRYKSVFFKWFSGVEMATTTLCAVAILALIAGISPILKITSLWPFILTYLLALCSLESLIIKRLIYFRRLDIPFYLNHIGIWILLFAAGIGSPDTKKYLMQVKEGETEWRVFDKGNEILELPIAIELQDFRMEEYPPKLAIIDRTTGIPQPEKRAEYIQIDTTATDGSILGWRISLEKYLHEAVRNSDGSYRAVSMPYTSPAAKIKAVNSSTGEILAGWVCTGNSLQPPAALNLNELYAVVMTNPEPKKFISEIRAFSKEGIKKEAILEVNKPLRIGNWTLYQYGYDNNAGKYSSYSTIELIYDPWIWAIYIGILLLLAGSVCMIWIGNKKR